MDLLNKAITFKIKQIISESKDPLDTIYIFENQVMPFGSNFKIEVSSLFCSFFETINIMFMHRKKTISKK